MIYSVAISVGMCPLKEVLFMFSSSLLNQLLTVEEPCGDGASCYKKIAWRTGKRLLCNDRSPVGSEQLLAQQSWDFHEAAMNMFTACWGRLHAAKVLHVQILVCCGASASSCLMQRSWYRRYFRICQIKIIPSMSNQWLHHILCKSEHFVNIM